VSPVLLLVCEVPHLRFALCDALFFRHFLCLKYPTASFTPERDEAAYLINIVHGGKFSNKRWHVMIESETWAMESKGGLSIWEIRE